MRNTIADFVESTRAGATAVTAVAVTVMAVGASALLMDHAWVIDQRDTLKAAGDAGGIAAANTMNRMLDADPNTDVATLIAALEPVVKRYVVMNLGHLPEDRYQLAVSTLDVEVTPVPRDRTVDVQVSADMGSRLFDGLFGIELGGTNVQTQSRLATEVPPVEVVLAVDLSDSMLANLAGDDWSGPVEEKRITIVKAAIENLVTVLNPNPTDRVAIGVVPWTYMVRLEPDTAAEWASNGWAKVPSQLTYGYPYRCGRGACPPPTITEAVDPPPADSEWRGCLDAQRMTGVGTAASVDQANIFFSMPSQVPFAQRYYPVSMGTAYNCLTAPLPANLNSQVCFKGESVGFKVGRNTDLQYACRDAFPSMTPLTADRVTIDDAIDDLVPVPGLTHSGLGVLWAQRMLDHSWNSVWGGGEHPVDPEADGNEKLRKVIVLLTDGKDTQCGRGNDSCNNSVNGVYRMAACDAAKAAGTEIFVIAAIHPGKIGSGFATALAACATQSTDATEPYVFMNNATAEDVDAAFTEIALRLRTVKRVH